MVMEFMLLLKAMCMKEAFLIAKSTAMEFKSSEMEISIRVSIVRGCLMDKVHIYLKFRKVQMVKWIVL